MKYTPGPWKIANVQDTQIVRQGNSDKAFVIWNENECLDVCYFRTGLKNRANATLIESAPELLEACKHVLEVLSYESEPQSTKTMTMLKNLIDKAEDRS